MDDKDTQPQPERSERETPSSQTSEAAASGALVEPPEAAVTRLETELGQLKDRYLRLAAEYDNFRKRIQKERTELWQRAQADLIRRFVDAIDDLTRFARVDPAQTDARTMHEGVDMVARKFMKQLEAVGVTRVDQAGVPFDPKLHDAVTTGPADDPAKDDTVGAVLQPGYQLAGMLIRPARVVVLKWQGEADERGRQRGPQGESG